MNKKSGIVITNQPIRRPVRNLCINGTKHAAINGKKIASKTVINLTPPKNIFLYNTEGLLTEPYTLCIMGL